MKASVITILALIKQLKVHELKELTKRLSENIENPPSYNKVGAYPKKPRPSLRGGAEALPEEETKELISVISKQIVSRK